MASRMTRRATLSLCGLALGGAAKAQQGGAAPFSQERFLNFAASSAEFQRRAAAIASSRDTRPQVKAFATDFLRFREDQSRRLREAIVAAGGRGEAPELEQEHRVVLENLEPLDYLALSRRYMEVAMEALAQEERGYQAASGAAQGAVRQLAGDVLPEIRRWRDRAQEAWQAVAP